MGRGCGQVVAAGGDGTVSLLAAAMMKAKVGTVPLGVFPGGTANMLCKEMGNPTSWPGAAAFLATTTSTLPLRAAVISAVSPSGNALFGSAPALIRSSTTGAPPRSQASSSGVTP